MAREYSSEEEMIRMSRGDVEPRPNMCWSAFGMKRHSQESAAGYHQTTQEFWVLQSSYVKNVPTLTLINISVKCDVFLKTPILRD